MRKKAPAPKLQPPTSVRPLTAEDHAVINALFTTMATCLPPNTSLQHALQATCLFAGAITAQMGGYKTEAVGGILRHATAVVTERAIQECVRHELSPRGLQ